MLHIVGDSKSGGVTRIVMQLASGAALSGWEVDVLTTDQRFSDRLASEGIGVLRLDVFQRRSNLVKDIRDILRLSAVIRQRGYDVVHTHRPKVGVLGRLSAHLARAPHIIHTAHGFAFREESSLLFRKAVTLSERVASRWTDKVVAVSRYHARQMIDLKMAPERKVVAIPNGIIDLLPEFDAHVQRPRAVGSRRFNLVVVGRLAPQKGLEELIGALAIVKFSADRDFSLTVVGDGPLLDDLQREALHAGISENVCFLGFRDDIAQILLRADLVVLPSLREGLSIALLEAMSCARPIIASSIPGNREATDDGSAAWLVTPGSVVDLAGAVLHAMGVSESQRLELGAKARQRFLDNFLSSTMTARYLELYTAAQGS